MIYAAVTDKRIKVKYNGDIVTNVKILNNILIYILVIKMIPKEFMKNHNGRWEYAVCISP